MALEDCWIFVFWMRRAVQTLSCFTRLVLPGNLHVSLELERLQGSATEDELVGELGIVSQRVEEMRCPPLECDGRSAWSKEDSFSAKS